MNTPILHGNSSKNLELLTLTPLTQNKGHPTQSSCRKRTSDKGDGDLHSNARGSRTHWGTEEEDYRQVRLGTGGQGSSPSNQRSHSSAFPGTSRPDRGSQGRGRKGR